MEMIDSDFVSLPEFRFLCLNHFKRYFMSMEVDRINQIWEKFRFGDKEAFAEVYNTFIDDLYRYGTKLCTDEEMVKDSIQEIFLDLYLNRKDKTVFASGLKFYLILGLKRNLVRKMQRGRKSENRKINETDLFDTQYSFEEQIISEEISAEKNEKVNLAISQLPPRQKEAIYLRYNQSLEYEQISEMLGVTVESVRKQVYRAIKAIRGCFDEKGMILFSIIKSHQLFPSGEFTKEEFR